MAAVTESVRLEIRHHGRRRRRSGHRRQPARQRAQLARAPGPVRRACTRRSTDGAKAIVVICDGRTFIAGADITEFGGGAPDAASLHARAGRHGGRADAGDRGDPRHGARRRARGRAVRPLPGGAWRRPSSACPRSTSGCCPAPAAPSACPRLTGVPKALEMMTSGRPHRHRRGARSAASSTKWSTAISTSCARRPSPSPRRAVAEDLPLARVRDRDDKVADARGDDQLFADFRASIARKTRGFLAPEYNIRCIEAAANLPFDEGLQVERQAVRGADDRPPVGRPALLLLRRAGRQQDPRRRQGHADARHPARPACSAPARWAAASR